MKKLTSLHLTHPFIQFEEYTYEPFVLFKLLNHFLSILCAYVFIDVKEKEN